MAATITDPMGLVDFLRSKCAADPIAASAGFKRVSDLTPDPSPESMDVVKKFVAAGGVSAVVATMKAHCENLNETSAVHKVELCDVQERGCVVLMNLAGAALAGNESCAKALADESAVGTVIRAIERYPDTFGADLGEAVMSALMQLSILDLSAALAAGVVPVVTRGMQEPQAGGWLLFLCARTLSWVISTGDGAASQMLRDAGAVDALLSSLRRAVVCDPECGVPYGLPDALDQFQVVARHTLHTLTAAPDAPADDAPGGVSEGVLRVAVFLEGDAAVLMGLAAKPELNGCGGTIVEAAEAGYGPLASNGRYGFRVDLPREKRGNSFMVKAANLRLAPHVLAAKIHGSRSAAAEAAAAAASAFGGEEAAVG